MHQAKPTVAIVILCWNGKDFLQRFLPSVIENSKGYDIYVADNNSTDNSAQFVEAHFHGVKVIKIPENEGFAKGYNVALKQVSADYYILLNQDVEVTKNWIEPLVELLEQDNTIAACQPKLLEFNNKEKFEYAGAAGGFIDFFGYPFCRGRMFDVMEEDHGQYDKSMEVFWASGAALMIRAKLFHAFGGFEPVFFAHMEEIDLCWRLKKAGYGIYSCTNSTIYHVGGGSLHKSNPRKTYLNFRNNMLMLMRNLPGNLLWSRIILRLKLDQIAAFRLLLQGNKKDFKAIQKAHFDFLGSLGKWRKMRKENLANIRKNSIGNERLAGLYKGSIILDFFFRKKKKFSDLNQKKIISAE